MVKIVIDEHDGVTPYGITGDVVCAWHGEDTVWCDKQDLTDLRNQIDNILNRGE